MISSWYFGGDQSYLCVLWPTCFPLTLKAKKRISIPSLAMLVLASCKGHCYILAPTPSHQSASRWTSWSLQCCFPGGSPHTEWAYLGQSLPLQNPSPFPHTRCCFPTIPLAMLSATEHTNRGLSQSKVGANVPPVWEAGSWILSVLQKGLCSWISVGYFDLMVSWSAGEKDVWLMICHFELEEKITRSLH